MLKKGLILVFVLFTTSVYGSSIRIQPRYTNSFRFVATDVWNIDVLYSNPKGVNIYFVAEIIKDGIRIASVKSNTLKLENGIQTFSSLTLGTSQLNWHSRAVSEIENLTGSFPSGSYEICYNAYCVTSDCDGLGLDVVYDELAYCFEVVVEPPTPILLSFPEDKSEIEWARPTFIWIPPMPIGQISGFNYLMTLTEKDEYQTCTDAIMRNRPMYRQSGIDIPTLPYSSELDDLDTGKIYCWKVEGWNDGLNLANSEIWEFKLKKKKIIKRQTINILPSYQLRNESYKANINDTLQLVFEESYQFASNTKWKITLRLNDLNRNVDLKDIILTPIDVGNINIKLVPFESKNIETGRKYLICIENEKRERFVANIVFYE